MKSLSLVTIVKNEENRINKFLKHLLWVDEIIIVDNNSCDKTIKEVNKYTRRVYYSDESYGKLKQFALHKANSDWILMLDVDEFVSEELKKEILEVLSKKSDYVAYKIPYQNYFLNHKLVCRAQKYSKARLFKRGYGTVSSDPVHEEMIIKGKVGELKGHIDHYSFRSIPQIIKKFTYYASIEAPLLYQKGERVSLKKLTMYPMHMFWSIFFKDQGYKDGIWGFLLAKSFAYMEFMKYFLLLIEQIKDSRLPAQAGFRGNDKYSKKK